MKTPMAGEHNTRHTPPIPTTQTAQDCPRPHACFPVQRLLPETLPYVCVLLMILFLAGCGASTQEAIIGLWEVGGQTTTIEFNTNGTIIIVETKDDSSYRGTYVFTDDTTIELTMEDNIFGTPTLVSDVDIRGNQMALTGRFSPSSPLPTTLLCTKKHQ